MLVKMLNWSVASGSLGGATTQSSPAGQVVRKRPMPVNPNSERQIEARNFMSAASQFWTSASAVCRQGWDEYAAGVQIRNRLGDMVTVSGKAHFCRSNTAAQRGGLAMTEDYPTILELGEKDLSITIEHQDGSEQGGAWGNISVDFSVAAGSRWSKEDNGRLLVYAGAPQNSSVNFYKGPYRFAGKVDGITTGQVTHPVVFTNPWVSIEEGKKQFFYCRCLRADKRLSEKQFFTATIPADGSTP